MAIKNLYRNRQNNAVIWMAAPVVLLLCSGAFAWGRHDHNGSRVGYDYGVNGWTYYSPSGRGFIYAPPPVGTFFPYLPAGYTFFAAGNDTYYYLDGVYFLPASSGYVVVAPPSQPPAVVAPPSATVQYVPQVQASPMPSAPPQSLSAAPAQANTASSQPALSSDTSYVNIPNSQGGYTSVKIVKTKNGYLGPQGEFYPGHPSVAQLKALYGN